MHTITPTHPGWDGTVRPQWLTSMEELAAVYAGYLNQDDLQDVLVICSSIGGWIAAEMAARDDAGRITGLVLIDAVGVEVAGEPIRDFFALDARGVAQYTFHDADRYYVDPATLTPEQAARQQANMATMRVLAGDPYMHDPGLRDRLARLQVPALLIWGDSDRIATPAYGKAYATAFPDARFEIVHDAGHLPQLEQPGVTMSLIDSYVAGQTA